MLARPAERFLLRDRGGHVRPRLGPGPRRAFYLKRELPAASQEPEPPFERAPASRPRRPPPQHGGSGAAMCPLPNPRSHLRSGCGEATAEGGGEATAEGGGEGCGEGCGEACVQPDSSAPRGRGTMRPIEWPLFGLQGAGLCCGPV